MEVSLWCAIAAGVFFPKILGVESARLISTVCLGSLTVAWLLHWVFLRWFPFAFSWSTVAGIGLALYFLLYHWEELGPNSLTLLACLPLLAAIPGAFTDRQISRFMVFLCSIGGIQGLLCLIGPTFIEGKESLSKSLQEGDALTGLLSSEAELTAFLVCTTCAAATFAFWAIANLMPKRGSNSPGGRTNQLASAGANIALLGGFVILLTLIALFLCPSPLPLPTFLLTLIVIVVLLGAKGHLSTVVIVVALGLTLVAGGANLARPLPGNSGFSKEILQINVEKVVNADTQRARFPDETVERAAEGAQGWKGLFDRAEWGCVLSRTDSTSLILMGLFCLLLLVEGIFALVKYEGVQPILLTGSLAGVVGLCLTGVWGSFLSNPGLVILAVTFCAMASSGGEYDKEFEEVEFLT